MEKALEKIVDKALIQINQTIENAVDKAIEKSMAKYPKHVPGPASSHLIEKRRANQNGPRKVSELDDEEIIEMARRYVEASSKGYESSEDDDDEIIRLLSRHTSALSNPWPGYTCKIDVLGNKEFDLAVDKDMKLVLLPTREKTTPAGHLEKSRQWECIREKKWLRLRNVATGKYLGVIECCSEIYHLHALSLLDHPKEQTRFSLEQRSENSAWLEFPLLSSVRALTAEFDVETLRSGNCIEDHIHMRYENYRPEHAVQIHPSRKLSR